MLPDEPAVRCLRVSSAAERRLQNTNSAQKRENAITAFGRRVGLAAKRRWRQGTLTTDVMYGSLGCAPRDIEMKQRSMTRRPHHLVSASEAVDRTWSSRTGTKVPVVARFVARMS